MFDKYDDITELEPQPFVFKPYRYELWQDKKIIQSGSTNALIEATVKNGKIYVEIDDSTLFSILKSQTEFDKFVMATDRLRFINIPLNPTVNCAGIKALTMLYGPTRLEKDFVSNEPYCCNIFLFNKRLVKLTFSYSNPVRLLEFYYPSFDF